MKKFANFLFLFIVTSAFIYNALGYSVMLSSDKERVWIDMVQKKSSSGYMVLKLNASVYSFIEDSELENVNENVIINNNVYHIFQKKIKDNIVYLYYLPNNQQSVTGVKLKKFFDEESLKKHPFNEKPLVKDYKLVLKDYFPTDSYTIAQFQDYYSETSKIANHPKSELKKGFLKIAYSPPQSILSTLYS